MGEGAGKSKVILGTIISKVQIVFGVLIAAFFALGAIGSIGQENSGSTMIIALLLVALGVWLLLKGVKKGRLIKRFKQYVAVLSGDSLRSLDHLAAALGENIDSVRGNVEKMIKQGIMANAYINRETNCLVFVGQKAGVTPIGARNPGARPASAAAGGRTVVCKGCGAVNQVPDGGMGECEFCGSKLA